MTNSKHTSTKEKMNSFMKELNTTDVFTIKLVSKEELVTRITEFNDTEVCVRKPMCMIQTQNGVGMLPWVLTGGSMEQWINVQHILTITRSNQEVASSYIKSTTGLTI
jgi:hypothetical protein